eukprot:scaffold315831_cov33-Tisochrysis_lutea.AAC.1
MPLHVSSKGPDANHSVCVQRRLITRRLFLLHYPWFVFRRVEVCSRAAGKPTECLRSAIATRCYRLTAIGCIGRVQGAVPSANVAG